MNCEILHTLYIKSNGEVLCNDDYGERVTLANVSIDLQNATMQDLFSNQAYQHIRESLSGGQIPWEGVCEHCAFIRHDEPYADLLAQKHITKLQLEPSLLCNLNCRCCSNDLQIQQREKPHLMDPETYGSVLSSLKDGGFRLDSVEYCGQGEPLMHPQFAEFAVATKKYYPHAWQRVITNGNFTYQKTLGQAPVDEIMVACDGLHQESYSQYRVKGKVEKVLQFMSDAVAARKKGRPQVIWKYILFEFNDSEKEILAAQDKAQDIGVDTLVFVVTHSEYHSQKYTMESIASLPIVSPKVTTNAHPSFFDGVRYGSIKKTLARSVLDKLSKKCLARIDEVVIMPEDLLQIRGWAAATDEIERIVVSIGDKVLGETLPMDLRPDVEAVFPQFTRQPMGFRFSTKIEQEALKKSVLSIELYNQRNKRMGCFRFPCVFN